MKRERVEDGIDALFGRAKQYSPHGNNLTGGTVEYRDGDRVLEVVYKPGAPAPWFETPDGTVTHLPPVDETVESFRLVRRPAPDAEP